MPDDADLPLRGYAIVLLGSFNPPIFQPSWFARHELIEEDKADEATVVHIDADSSVFETTEFGCEVTRDRLRFFSVPTTDRAERLGEVAAKVFGFLYHTPIGAISMITFRHVPASTRRWDSFAPELAANKRWDEVLDGEAKLDRLVIRKDVAGPPRGILGLGAEASRLRPDGVYLSVTHQYTLSSEDAKRADVARGLMEGRWDDAVNQSDDIIDRAVSL